MGIRKITPLFDFGDLNLKPKTLEAIEAAGITPEQLVTEARRDAARKSWLAQRFESHLEGHDGIGKVRAQEIIAAVDKGGFILHESNESRWARRLLFQVESSLAKLLEHYEDLESMAPEALASVDHLVNEVLTSQELQILELHYGREGDCFTLEKCATHLKISPQQACGLHRKALTKLRLQGNITKLKVAACYSRKALGRKIGRLKDTIANAQQELDDLQEGSPYPEYTKDTTPIERLNFNKDYRTRILNCLHRAHIHKIEKLVATRRQDVLNIRNLGERHVADIERALAEINKSLS